jgi:uncharacterized membrane protein
MCDGSRASLTSLTAFVKSFVWLQSLYSTEVEVWVANWRLSLTQLLRFRNSESKKIFRSFVGGAEAGEKLRRVMYIAAGAIGSH